jgi:feruloyl esterase
MNGNMRKAFLLTASLFYLITANAWSRAQTITSPAAAENKVITEADCTAAKLGSDIPVSAIGEPVSGVTLSAPVWTAAAGANPAYCSVNGSMAPVDTAANAKPINFRVVLPSSWSRRAAQLGGGGMNGSIPNLLGGVDMGPGTSLIGLGFAAYGSDSGHQMGFGMGFGRGMTGGPPQASQGGMPQRGMMPGATPQEGAPQRGMMQGGAPPAGSGDDWALNDEAMKNLGYLQLKKTHDAAMVLIERIYGEKPRFSYFFGSSQGGREGLTVAQRYPADYDGVAANVPIVNFSSLMLAPALIRIQEKPLANWVPPAKVNAIRGEFMRQCDKLDGLVDGIINNYMACRAIFDRTQARRGSNPWSAKRCPNNVDPNPGDTSANACLTDGQISTLQFVYSRYPFATPLANKVKSFGMWVPNTDPSGSGLIVPSRYRSQEGAGDNAPVHSHMGGLGVTGFLMQNLKANPLDYVEGGVFDARRREISQSLDSTNPDLSAFYKRGGKLIVAIGTNDTLASPGAQLDYYQSVLKKMGRKKVEKFARFFVLPQAGHGLSGTNYSTDGNGKSIPTAPIPSTFSRLNLLMDWVEKNAAPPMALTVTGGKRSLPMCSYPKYPKYVSGPVDAAASYSCAAP